MLGAGGQDGLDADANLKTALEEFRALGDRFGMWLALTELADRIAVRGDLAGACELYEQAVAVLIETGAVEDVIPIRSRQAQLYWLLGDEDGCAAAMADAQRHAERVPWPSALVELALSQAELARWAGHPQDARRHLGAATAMLGDAAEQPDIRAVTHGPARLPRRRPRPGPRAPRVGLRGGGRGGVRADDREGTRRGRRPGAAPRPGRAGRAAAGGERRGTRAAGPVPPDEARIEREARSRLGDALFAEAAREGMKDRWPELVRATLAS